MFKFKKSVCVHRIEEVVLTPEDEETLKESIGEIKQICSLNKPQPAKKIKYCKNCSYYELCFS